MEPAINKTALVGNHEEWELETTFDGDEVAVWLTNNFNLGLGCALLYLAAVFAGKKYMENQPRFNLRQPMMIWSMLLALFSIIGSIRSMIVMYYIGSEEGFRGLVCSKQIYVGPITRFWGPVFVFSKILEYMDTVFIILRKQKLIFLHWYHHLTVSLYSWVCYGSQSAGGGIFMTANFIVHSMMYSYYAVRAAGIRVPRPIAITITSSQIVQMVIGSVAIYCAHIWRHDGNCKTSPEHVLYGGIMYGSYFVLFVHFFYVTYIRKQPGISKKELSETKTSEMKTTSFSSGGDTFPVEKSHEYNLRERKKI